jgi:hypothetical protein
MLLQVVSTDGTKVFNKIQCNGCSCVPERLAEMYMNISENTGRSIALASPITLGDPEDLRGYVYPELQAHH